MNKEEVIQEFVNDIEEMVTSAAKKNLKAPSTVFFLVSDKDGNCDVVMKNLPPLVIPETSEDIIKMLFLKFIWKQMLDEIKEKYDKVIHFVHTERLDFNDRSVLTFMRRDEDGNVIPKIFEIIEKDVMVSPDGEMVPTTIDLVEVDGEDWN